MHHNCFVIYKINVITEIINYLQFVSLVGVRQIGMLCVVHKSALEVSERFLKYLTCKTSRAEDCFDYFSKCVSSVEF